MRIMTSCPFCHCEIPDFCPYSMCPQCDQPLETRFGGNGVVRTEIRKG